MSERIRMEVKGLLVDPTTNVPMVLLRGVDQDYVLPIWVGVFEANAIALQLERIGTPRPMTHDLLLHVVEALGGRLEQVDVTDLRDGTFHASVVVSRDGIRKAVDARPSDAIALALRAAAPIFVVPDVIEKAKAFDPGSQDPEKLREWFQGLSSEEAGSAGA
jgi:bifunctional DNase/RNase